MKIKGLIFVILGPSGSGKTTLRDRLLEDKELKTELAKSISFTTRPKRSTEEEGKDYFFISKKQFIAWRRAKKFIEWTRYLDYYYATAGDLLERQLARGRHIILCLDLKGALNIRRIYPKNMVTIFIKPPSLGALQERIIKRCRDTAKEEVQRRLQLAKQELLLAQEYDYSLVNKEVGQLTKKLKGIILKEIGR